MNDSIARPRADFAPDAAAALFLPPADLDPSPGVGLEEGAAQFRFLADNLPQLVWTARPDGGLDYYNQRFYEYTGLTFAQACDWGWGAIMHPDDLSRCIDVWTHSLTTGQPYEIEYRLRRASDGAFRWHLGRALPRHDAQGGIVQWVGTCTDVDDNKRVQADLQTAHDTLEARVQERTAQLAWANDVLLEEIAERTRFAEDARQQTERMAAIIATQQDVATAGLDLQGVLTLICERTQTLTRASGAVIEILEGDDMVYRAASGTLSPFVGLRLASATSLSGMCVRAGEILRCDDTATDPRVNAEVCRKVGIRAMLVVPMYHAQQIVGVLKVSRPTPKQFEARDADVLQLMAGLIAAVISNATAFEARQTLITELAGALDALRESEARYRSLVSASAQIVWVTDPEGRAIEPIPTWDEFTGQTAAESSGFGWLNALHPDDLPTVQAVWASAATQRLYEVEYRLRHYSGDYRCMAARGIPVFDAAGLVRVWVGTCADVTERTQAEQALQAANRELARSNTDLEQFAYVASHDLQEPLRMIASYVELLQLDYADRLDDEGREFITYAVEGALRMKALINDLLAYSRVGSRQAALRPTFSEAILAATLMDLQFVIAETQTVVTYDALPTVLADATQMHLLLQNLLSNAIKFRADRPPRIHLSATRNGSEWTFAVRDNGIGISSKHAERIFVLFQRLHSKQKYSGTGIGLAVCKRVVERHGGRIWIESTPGEGTTFFFTLLADDSPSLGSFPAFTFQEASA